MKCCIAVSSQSTCRNEILEPLAGLLSLERLYCRLDHDGPRLPLMLPPGISQLRSLTYLCLPQMTSRHGDIATHDPLRSDLDVLNGQICQIANLSELCLGLEDEVPSCIGTLHDLSQIRGFGNRKQCIQLPSSLQQCSGLTFLHIGKFKMPIETAWEEPGKSLQALSSLKCLTLSHMIYH